MIYHRACLLVLAAILLAEFTYAQTTMCTGYPKMYNGLPCASTTRYWDGQMGACGCGTGNSAPFAFQWEKLTAAGSAPIYGSGTWCGSGCGKCYKLTPTAVGATPQAASSGATSTKSYIAKVTNLCPYAGNEQWCAYDINTYGYDAHFDLMDYNMNGLVSQMGWNNPEVTYEEVDCVASGYTDWNCGCASATDNSTVSSVSAPSAPAPSKAATEAPAPSKAATEAPAPAKATVPAAAPATGAASAGSVQVQVNAGSNAWWFGFSIVGTNDISTVEIMDNDSAVPSWTAMSYQGDANWNMYSYNSAKAMATPLSLRFTSASGQVSIATDIITSFQSGVVDTKLTV